jgi:small-conductance mechanosensitive channel
MNEFQKYWEFPLITLSSGPEITVGQVVMAFLVTLLGILFSWYLQRALGRQLKRSGVNPNVTQTVQRIVFSSVLLLLFITVLGMLRVPVTALAFVSGAVAIGVGFGAQNIINNLISSWILLSERPVRIGDFVEKELRTIRSDIRFRIEELFIEHGIVIAFPQRDIHLYAKTPIEVTTRQT